jgi:hypothetical protein
MSETTEGKLTVGTHFEEIPKFYPIRRNGKRKKIGKSDFFIGPENIKEVRLYEGIETPCVHGWFRFMDPGVMRISTIMREGYDYFEAEFQSNYFKEKPKVIRFEVTNIEGVEEGRLMNGYDIITVRIVQYPAYRNLNVWKISKGYKDQKVSDLVDDVFENFINKSANVPYKKETDGGVKTIQTTKNKLESFCIPFWSPLHVFDYLKDYAYTGEGDVGFYFFFDLWNTFHFRSCQHLMTQGTKHEFKLKEIRNTTLAEASEETKPYIRDYYANLVQKQYYQFGLSGSCFERFNWFTKRQYMRKVGYKKAQPDSLNKLFEVPKDINNMFGYHGVIGYRGQEHNDFIYSRIGTTLLTSKSAQARTHVVINGKPDLHVGDTLKIKLEEKGINNNVEELDGKWFVRAIDHIWNATSPYSQLLHLSRDGIFIHRGP